MPRALHTVLDTLLDAGDPTVRIVRDLRMVTADLDAAVTDLGHATDPDQSRSAKLRRVHALRSMIDTLAVLEIEWSREL